MREHFQYSIWSVCRQRLWNKLARLYKGGFLVHHSDRRERRRDRNHRHYKRVPPRRSRTFAGLPVSSIKQKKRSASCWMDCVVRRALPDRRHRPESIYYKWSREFLEAGKRHCAILCNQSDCGNTDSTNPNSSVSASEPRIVIAIPTMTQILKIS